MAGKTMQQNVSRGNWEDRWKAGGGSGGVNNVDGMRSGRWSGYQQDRRRSAGAEMVSRRH